MDLPDILFKRSNGQLRRVQPIADRVGGLVLSGAAVEGKIALNEAHLLTSADDIAALGITEANNPLAYHDLTAYFSKALDGCKVWLILYSDALLLNEVCDKDNGPAKKLILAAGGEIRAIFVNRLPPIAYRITLVDGLDGDVWDGVAKMQALIEQQATLNAPFYAVLPGLGFDVANLEKLRDLNTMKANRVSILLGSDVSSGRPAIGVIAGWRTVTGVNENIGWVGLGAVLEKSWLGTKATDAPEVAAKLGTIHQKRYIIFRKIAGKSGFFFNDDPTATSVADDYSSISWNAVMDKAQILAYNSLVNHLNEDYTIDENTGKISAALAAGWEGEVESAIITAMKNTEEISGVRCIIDVDRTELSSDQLYASLEIVRKGQAKYINIAIGFVKSLS